MMTNWDDVRIVESIFLTELGEPIELARTWRERLWSWPWQPWRRTVMYIPLVPYKGAVRISRNTILMHPETARQLKEQQHAKPR